MNIIDTIKRALNKNAMPRPVIANDYTSAVQVLSAERTATIHACMDKIAAEFASLNFAIYNKKTRKKAKNHAMNKVLREPNSEERRFMFFYQSAIDYLNGGCYWLKSTFEGVVWGLNRLNRYEVQVLRNPSTNEKYYTYNGRTLKSSDVIYIPSRFSYNTKQGGVSIFEAAESTFETMRRLEKFTQSSFITGIVGERVLIDIQKAYPDCTAEQAEAIRQDFINKYSGVENAGKPVLKKAGFEYTTLGKGVDSKSVELTENRKFQEHEIAKVFGIPERLLSTGGGENGEESIEDAFLLFNEFAIRPMAAQFQDAINSMLDEEEYYFEFDYNGVLKVSFEKRIDAYIKQITNGLLSPNEARGKENMDSIEAGDNYFMPVNLMPLNKETIAAYMAKQKNEAAKGIGEGAEAVNPTDEGAQHFKGGDDKQ